MKKHYEEIILNYATSIEQLHKIDDYESSAMRPNLKQSMVKLDIQEEE